MPKLEEITTSRGNKQFKKRSYRPWNESGESTNIAIEQKEIEPTSISSNASEAILEISPFELKNWIYHDRPENELGDIEALANEFKEIGQLQPCIVRPYTSDDEQFKYELIVGERRWRAAQLSGTLLKVLVKHLSDSEAAITQASENYNRKDLSDYARGMSYSRLIEEGILTPKSLTQSLNMSKQQISRLLSFSKIPAEIIDAIQDLSKISARTAEQIKQLSNKGELYISAIISCAEKLKTGEYGHEKLYSYVEKLIHHKKKNNKSVDKLYSREGLHLFTLKNIDNSSTSIHFNKDIISLLEQKNIDLKNVAYKISQLLEEYINKN